MMRRRSFFFGVAAATLLAGAASADPVGDRVAAAALAQTEVTTVYDPAYAALDYPGGDVPADRGVCADVVVRSLRAVGVDLQRLVHEDMRAHFRSYPQRWGARGPDANIDHRRVPNLSTYLARKGARLPLTTNFADFAPGDVVAWNLAGAAGELPHIGVVAAARTRDGRPLVVHNIGAGARLEDVLFRWPMTGHFRPALLASRTPD